MRAALKLAELPNKQPMRGTFFACCASAGWVKTRRIAVSSQKSFGFMAAPIYGQWVCHSPNPMKTDIFADNEGGESGESTRGSIRFDSLSVQRVRVRLL